MLLIQPAIAIFDIDHFPIELLWAIPILWGKRTFNADYKLVLRDNHSNVWDEHAPPHFHAIYGEFEVLVEIRTLAVIRGKIPRRAMALVLEWASLYREELMEDWKTMRTKAKHRTR